MEITRLIKYYRLRFVRLKGEPHELALGMASGVFSGMLPIMPFQTALAVTLAIFTKGSKITAALGTWVSNPLNWYFLYYNSYKLGSLILGLPEKKRVFSSIVTAIEMGEKTMVILGKILGAGSAFVMAFLIGGFVMGSVLAPITYFIFLHLFKSIRHWRHSKKERKDWRTQNQ